jgi:hypothetical protein
MALQAVDKPRVEQAFWGPFSVAGRNAVVTGGARASAVALPLDSLKEERTSSLQTSISPLPNAAQKAWPRRQPTGGDARRCPRRGSLQCCSAALCR